ncbi:hypothetical protein WMY93_004059 [Mugilogobius chulae]|uniref:Protein kinase domain-containing protein n=1 Tax=Mugilogobius chulae TaxID=88201 RepID=A0AAW0PYU3_9GOBI
MKRRKDLQNAVGRELSMLKALKPLDPEENNIVAFNKYFQPVKGVHCFEFEGLDVSVKSFMKQLNRPIYLEEIRTMAKDLLIALDGLKRLGVMHTDIKPDNIMFVDQEKQPFKVKLIDFGVAKFKSNIRIGQNMQPPAFRAPEVTLGLPLTEAVDMWGLGCCLLHWHTQYFPFLPNSPYDHIRQIVDLLGLPDGDVINQAQSGAEFFIQEASQWRLKTPQEYKNTTQTRPKLNLTNVIAANNLEDFIQNAQENMFGLDFEDRRDFVDLLIQMFHLNPEKRITPSEALRHPFIMSSKQDSQSPEVSSTNMPLSGGSMGSVNIQSDAIGNSPTLSSVLKDQGEESPGQVNMESLPFADLDKQNGVNTFRDTHLNDKLEAQRPTTSSTLETISKIQIVDEFAFQEMLSKMNPNVWREGEVSGKTVYASSKTDSEPGGEKNQGAVSQATVNNHFTNSWLTQGLQDKNNASTTTDSPSPPLSNSPTKSISAVMEDFVSPDLDTSSDSEWILQAAEDCYHLRGRTTASCWSVPQESPRNSISAFMEDFVSPDLDTSSESESILQAAEDCYHLRGRTTTSYGSLPQESPQNSISAFMEDFVSPDLDTSSDSEWILQAAEDCYHLRGRTAFEPASCSRNSISASMED